MEKTKSAETGSANKADLTSVLNELKALRTEFGSKLDGIERHMSDVSDSVKSLENSLSVVKQTVESNESRISETESRIECLEAELEGTLSTLAAANKRLIHLEAKTDDLENRARRKNLSQRGSRGLAPSFGLCKHYASTVARSVIGYILHAGESSSHASSTKA